MGVSNVGGDTIMNEQAYVYSELRARLPCLQEVWQATIGEELDCWRELNNRLQRILLAYVFDTASIAFVCTRSTLAMAFVLSIPGRVISLERGPWGSGI